MNLHETQEALFWEMLDKLISEQGIWIDRPKGSRHPVHTDYIYPLDYGYLQNTVSSDGAGIDVWVGSSDTGTASAVITSVDMWKKDSEIKILVSCTEEEIEKIYQAHNSTSGMKGLLNVRSITNG